MPERLFVYGTLRRQSSAHGLLDGSRYLARASLGGTLYDLGEYPGLVRSQASGRRVVGEVYELPAEKAPRMLRALDRYEGREFVRRRTFVTLSKGGRRAAWVYVLRSTPKSAKKIASGRY
jgi:gamma-glutamylcyclotransferase (GGCT)/AIG2-like uncharacterized protein YtfP